jgi:hypothetical protein
MPSHSKPTEVVTEYFDTIRWLADSAESTQEERVVRRLATLATVTAVNAVEVFLNLWFRVWVEECKDESLREEFRANLKVRFSLEQKLNTWPKRYFAKELNLKHGPGFEFMKLKNLRNAVVHFTSSHESIHTPGMIVHGLADTSEYDSLDARDARNAVNVAEEIVSELLRIAGFDEATVRGAMASWLGAHGPNPRLSGPRGKVALGP